VLMALLGIKGRRVSDRSMSYELDGEY
jgi:hypothetical protein